MKLIGKILLAAAIVFLALIVCSLMIQAKVGALWTSFLFAGSIFLAIRLFKRPKSEGKQ